MSTQDFVEEVLLDTQGFSSIGGTFARGSHSKEPTQACWYVLLESGEFMLYR